MTSLIIAAHPDDEVLGCGGTMARLANEGHCVYVVILGEGLTSRYSNRSDVDQASMAALHQRSHDAGRILGVKQVFLHGLPDNRFDTVALLDVVKILEQHIAELKPAAVYTQHGGDLNIDHVVTYRATLTATRPVSGTPVKAVYAYEVGSSTEWAFQNFSPQFRPNVFVDINATLPKKLEAMQNYESEARPFPHPRSPEALRASALRWGAVSGLAAAEAFEIVREIR